MTQPNKSDPQPSVQDVALIVGGGPGISASCARLFAESGMRVGIAARNPDKSVLQTLEKTRGVRRYGCDASEPAAVDLLFKNVVRDLGAPTLLIHNIDGRVPGIFGKAITDADPSMVLETLRNSAFSAFLVGQQAARLMRENQPNARGARGTIIFTNASAALKGFPSSGAFAMACHAKSGLAQSMARELMPQGIHVANVPIDAAIGWTQEDGTRAHRRAGTTVDDNMADPDCIAETYLQLLERLTPLPSAGASSGDFAILQNPSSTTKLSSVTMRALDCTLPLSSKRGHRLCADHKDVDSSAGRDGRANLHHVLGQGNSRRYV